MTADAVHLAITDVPVCFALTYVLERVGYRRVHDPVEAGTRVADANALRHGPPVSALVVNLLPAECQLALDAVASGAALSVVCTDDPESLPGALEAARNHTVTLPARLVEAANRAPRLGSRQLQTLQMILTGCTNDMIAKRLRTSESTAKRDIGILLDRFDVDNRRQLVGAARAAGFRP